MKFTSVVKSGKLANGKELGKGRRVHAHQAEVPYISVSLCGDSPAVQWSVVDSPITCEQCLKMLNQKADIDE